MNIPLLADKNHSVSRAYGVLKEDEGISFRGLFIIDGNSKLRQVGTQEVSNFIRDCLRFMHFCRLKSCLYSSSIRLAATCSFNKTRVELFIERFYMHSVVEKSEILLLTTSLFLKNLKPVTNSIFY